MEENKSYLRDTNQIQSAIYTKSQLLEYKNNPCIEALPPISEDQEIANDLSFYPEFNEIELSYPKNIRKHCVERLNQYFQPMMINIEIDQKVSRAMHQGYINRNPINSDFFRSLNGMRKYIDKLDDISNYKNFNKTSSYCFSLIGLSGVGKSTAIKRVLSRYPRVIKHTKYNGEDFNFYQLPFVKIDCPHDGLSIKALCIKFFQYIDRHLNSNYTEKYGTTRNSEAVMLAQMVQVARIHAIGILIIDEIQYLKANSQTGHNRITDFLVTMINELDIPVMLIGNTDALPMLRRNFRDARRAEGDQGSVLMDKVENGAEWDLLVKGLISYNWTKSLIEFSKEISDLLYEETQGIIDVLIKLFKLTQEQAIDRNIPVTLELIKQVANKELKIIRPMLEALKSKSADKMATYADIVPLKIAEKVSAINPTLTLDDKMQLIKEAIIMNDKVSKDELFEKVALELYKTGLIEKNVAIKLAKKVINNNPDINYQDAIKEAFSLWAFTVKESKPDHPKSKGKPNDTKQSKNVSLFNKDTLEKNKKGINSILEGELV